MNQHFRPLHQFQVVRFFSLIMPYGNNHLGYNLQLCLTEVVMPSNKKPLYRFSFLTDSAAGREA